MARRLVSARRIGRRVNSGVLSADGVEALLATRHRGKGLTNETKPMPARINWQFGLTILGVAVLNTAIVVGYLEQKLGAIPVLEAKLVAETEARRLEQSHLDKAVGRLEDKVDVLLSQNKGFAGP